MLRLLLPILFGFAGARVGHREAAVDACDNFEVGAVAVTFGIGDERFGAVVRGVGIFRGMHHP